MAAAHVTKEKTLWKFVFEPSSHLSSEVSMCVCVCVCAHVGVCGERGLSSESGGVMKLVFVRLW